MENRPRTRGTTTEIAELEEIRVGDWLELRGVGDRPARRGQIVGLLGRPGHPHFRVRWDDEEESIVYPADHAFRVYRVPAHAPSARKTVWQPAAAD